MLKVRKIPTRRCVGCGENKPKKELIRIVKNKENEIFIDKTGKKNGRGAYICSNLNCFEKIRKSKALNKAFEMEIKEETYDELRNSIE